MYLERKRFTLYYLGLDGDFWDHAQDDSSAYFLSQESTQKLCCYFSELRTYDTMPRVALSLKMIR